MIWAKPVPYIGFLNPRSMLHAAEMELAGVGLLNIRRAFMYYRDRKTKVILARWAFSNNVHAGLELNFYRQSARDLRENRKAFCVIEGGKQDTPQSL